MKLITDPTAVAYFQKLTAEMTVAMGTYERDFEPVWVRDHTWKVVPVKSEISHFGPEEIKRIVRTLRGASYAECIAVATEPLGRVPECYQVTISEEGFRNFNRECGLLRFLLMHESRSWAISCYGVYKLFAGPTEMLQSLLGVLIRVARKAFSQFAEELELGDSENLLLKTALRYEGT